jgi:hypothetical protein
MVSCCCWLSLMVGSTTGVPMSRGYGGYPTATSPPYQTTYATTGYYTTKAQEYYTTTYDVPNIYTVGLIHSALSYSTGAPPRERSTTPPRERSTTPPSLLPHFLDRGSKYYSVPSHYIEAPVYYTTTWSNTTLKRPSTTLPRITS